MIIGVFHNKQGKQVLSSKMNQDKITIDDDDETE